MERTMSVEDKIRRAEEIYARRRQKEYKVTNTRVSVDNTTKANDNINQRLKKMIMQIIVCMLIYLTFYYVINNNYIFSEDFKTKCEEILSYDISFNEMYKNIEGAINTVKEKYQSIMQKSNTNDNEENKPEQENEQNNSNVDDEQTGADAESTNSDAGESNDNQELENNQTENTLENGQEQPNLDENIGGAEEVASVAETTEENLSEEEQMKKDAEEIKANINFIKPLQGTITSVFGWRNPTVSTVSKYHTGLDIAAKTGTDIISATNGKVVLASSTGAYGNHLKIEVQGIIVIYAHCSELLVKEGDEITQGQVIAKVGSTGNSTGPHLHLEIRKDDRYVNPKLILDY